MRSPPTRQPLPLSKFGTCTSFTGSGPLRKPLSAPYKLSMVFLMLFNNAFISYSEVFHFFHIYQLRRVLSLVQAEVVKIP